jgi:hypothetical protein
VETTVESSSLETGKLLVNWTSTLDLVYKPLTRRVAVERLVEPYWIAVIRDVENFDEKNQLLLASQSKLDIGSQ